MKTALSRKFRKLGNTILAVLIICSALAVAVMGYLSVVEQQSLLSARSQAWNMAIAIVEAGVEEGLQHLNSNRTNLLVDGWSYVNNVYVRSNTLPDGNRYEVSIAMTNSPIPVIVSQAYVIAPVFHDGAFAAIGTPNQSATL